MGRVRIVSVLTAAAHPGGSPGSTVVAADRSARHLEGLARPAVQSHLGPSRCPAASRQTRAPTRRRSDSIGNGGSGGGWSGADTEPDPSRSQWVSRLAGVARAALFGDRVLRAPRGGGLGRGSGSVTAQRVTAVSRETPLAPAPAPAVPTVLASRPSAARVSRQPVPPTPGAARARPPRPAPFTVYRVASRESTARRKDPARGGADPGPAR